MRVRGNATLYQNGSTDAFGDFPSTSLDDAYGDVVSVTFGDPRTHLFSYVFGFKAGGTDDSNCPAIGGATPPLSLSHTRGSISEETEQASLPGGLELDDERLGFVLATVGMVSGTFAFFISVYMVVIERWNVLGLRRSQRAPALLALARVDRDPRRERD